VGYKKCRPGRSTKQTHTIRNWVYSQMGGYKARTYIISEKATHSSSLSQPTAPYNRAVHHGARPPNVLYLGTAARTPYSSRTGWEAWLRSSKHTSYRDPRRRRSSAAALRGRVGARHVRCSTKCQVKEPVVFGHVPAAGWHRLCSVRWNASRV
jgi:hypothetical protein